MIYRGIFMIILFSNKMRVLFHVAVERLVQLATLRTPNRIDCAIKILFNNTNGTTIQIWIGQHVLNPVCVPWSFCVHTMKLPKWPNWAFKNDYNKTPGRQLMYKYGNKYGLLKFPCHIKTNAKARRRAAPVVPLFALHWNSHHFGIFPITNFERGMSWNFKLQRAPKHRDVVVQFQRHFGNAIVVDISIFHGLFGPPPPHGIHILQNANIKLAVRLITYKRMSHTFHLHFVFSVFVCTCWKKCDTNGPLCILYNSIAEMRIVHNPLRTTNNENIQQFDCAFWQKWENTIWSGKMLKCERSKQ